MTTASFLNPGMLDNVCLEFAFGFVRLQHGCLPPDEFPPCCGPALKVISQPQCSHGKKFTSTSIKDDSAQRYLSSLHHTLPWKTQDSKIYSELTPFVPQKPISCQSNLKGRESGQSLSG